MRDNDEWQVPLATPPSVDAICDVFEAAWAVGHEPRIEDFLPRGDSIPGDVLLQELLLAEWDLRRRNGQHSDLQTYCGRFPQSRRSITDLWRVWNEERPECVRGDQTLGLGAVRSPAFEEQSAAVVDRYQLVEKLGEGGFGTVWVAEQREPVKRQVALKIIKFGMDTNEIVARFQAERQAVAVMNHPSIAKILDAGSTQTGRPYFVMELVRGIPITQYCDQERLTTRDRLQLFMKVCHAIQHAHQKGIIHRDIKPSNILVIADEGVPVPKVIDFGIAKAIQGGLTDKTIYTQFKEFIGTPAYMSPEQAEMSRLDIDTRSDIYSLGVLLYELLTGATPFDANHLMQSGLEEMRKIIRERVPLRPSSRMLQMQLTRNRSDSKNSTVLGSFRVPQSTIDKDLDWIVMKCLEKDRTRRYETANGLAVDLKRHLANEPVMARPPSRAYLLRKLFQRNRGPILSVSLVLFVLVGGIIGTTWGMIRAEQARRDVVSAELAKAQRTLGERRAKEEVQKRRAQIGNATEILAAVFRDFDPEAAEEERVTHRVLLARSMSGAARYLEGEAVGDPLVVARLQYVLAIPLRRLGHLDQAERVLVSACETQKRLLGNDDLETAATKHQLAMLYHAQARYDKAEVLYDEVLATRTAELGLDHRETLTSRHRLAVLYKSQGKYARAEALCKQVLAIRTAKLGADDPDTLESQIALAGVYRSLRKITESELLYQEVLAVRQARFGTDHLDTIATKAELAALYHIQGKFALAEPLYKEAVLVRTAKLGPNHPATLVSRHQLATLYQFQGKLALAEALSKEVLADRIATLGADHPHTLSNQHQLAQLYVWQADFDLAETMYKDVLVRRAAKLGADHPDTADIKYDLAELYQAQAKYDLAEAHFQQVVAIRMAKLGADHIDTLESQNSLAALYRSIGKDVFAEALYQQVLAIRIANLGADHMDTLESQNRLAALYQATGKDALAEPHYKQVLAIRTFKLGADHADTVLSRDNLATLYWSMSKHDQSIPLMEETLEQTKTEVGPDHPDTLRRQVTLAANYCGAGRVADAISLLEQVRQKGSQDPHPNWVSFVLLTAYVQAGNAAEATRLATERVRNVRQEFAADSPELAAALAENGKALLDARAYADAEPLLRESLSIRDETARDVYDAHQVRSLFGAALLGQQKYAAAEPLLLDGYNGLRRTETHIPAQVKNVWLPDALERLVKLYDQWGKPDEAARWRKNL